MHFCLDPLSGTILLSVQESMLVVTSNAEWAPKKDKLWARPQTQLRLETLREIQQAAGGTDYPQNHLPVHYNADLMSLRPQGAAVINCILCDCSLDTHSQCPSRMWGHLCGHTATGAAVRGSADGSHGCPVALNSAQQLHRCLARVVDYDLPEEGGLTSSPAKLGRARGERPDQCLLWHRMPSLCSVYSVSRPCMKVQESL